MVALGIAGAAIGGTFGCTVAGTSPEGLNKDQVAVVTKVVDGFADHSPDSEYSDVKPVIHDSCEKVVGPYLREPGKYGDNIFIDIPEFVESQDAATCGDDTTRQLQAFATIAVRNAQAKGWVSKATPRDDLRDDLDNLAYETRSNGQQLALVAGAALGCFIGIAAGSKYGD